MRLRRILAALLAILFATQTQGDAVSDALAARDYAAALAAAQQAAGDGSAEAMLQLGTIHDFGLGVPRDAARAMRWYLAAAERGLPDAQFNVAVLLDSGVARPRDPAAAAIWYGRAAANGHARAHYNLALLYEEGEGVPRNIALARSWLERAAPVIAAAGDRLSQLPAAEPGRLHAPRIAAAALVETEAGRRAELVWESAEQPAGTSYQVQVASRDRIAVADPPSSTASALSWTPPDAVAAVRVVAIAADRDRYAASDWMPFGAEDAFGPLGTVRLQFAPQDLPAARLSAVLQSDLAASSLVIREEASDAGIGETAVLYVFAQDRALAEGLASYLPVLAAGDARQDRNLPAGPGEVVIRLSGGPGEARASSP